MKDGTADTIAYVLNKENLVREDIDLFAAAIEGMSAQDVSALLLEFSGRVPGKFADLAKKFADMEGGFDRKGIVYGFNKVNAHDAVGRIAARAMRYMKTDESRRELVRDIANTLPGMELELARLFGVLEDATRSSYATGGPPYRSGDSSYASPGPGIDAAQPPGSYTPYTPGPADKTKPSYKGDVKPSAQGADGSYSSYDSEQASYTGSGPNPPAGDGSVVVPAVPSMENVRKILKDLQSI